MTLTTARLTLFSGVSSASRSISRMSNPTLEAVVSSSTGLAGWPDAIMSRRSFFEAFLNRLASSRISACFIDCALLIAAVSVMVRLYGRPTGFSLREVSNWLRSASVNVGSDAILPLAVGRGLNSGMSSANTMSMYCPAMRRSSATLTKADNVVTGSCSPLVVISTLVAESANDANQVSQSLIPSRFIWSSIT